MTLTLEQVAGWLLQKDADLEGRVTVGAIDANYDRCVGVYNDNRASGGQRICIGGAACTRYAYKYVTLLVHWTTNPVTAEKKAIELYEKLYGLSYIEMGGVQVVSADPGAAPVPVGRDVKKVYEYVINLKICYRKE